MSFTCLQENLILRASSHLEESTSSTTIAKIPTRCRLCSNTATAAGSSWRPTQPACQTGLAERRGFSAHGARWEVEDVWRVSGDGVEGEDALPEAEEIPEKPGTLHHMANWLDCVRRRAPQDLYCPRAPATAIRWPAS